MAASSRSSSSGIASSSAFSRAIWRSNSSRWLCIEMYSPAAMLKAPARRPAIPARRMKPPAAEAPATPITSDRLDTSPSDTPNMVARRVPDRPLVCQRSPLAIVSAAFMSPGSMAGCFPATRSVGVPRRRPGFAAVPVPTALVAFASPSRRFQISACSRSSAAMASTAGCVSCPAYAASSSPSRALTRSLTKRVLNRRARMMMNRTRARGRPAAGTVAPNSRRRSSQMPA